jgi:hypothetical protein
MQGHHSTVLNPYDARSDDELLYSTSAGSTLERNPKQVTSVPDMYQHHRSAHHHHHQPSHRNATSVRGTSPAMRGSSPAMMVTDQHSHNIHNHHHRQQSSQLSQNNPPPPEIRIAQSTSGHGEIFHDSHSHTHSGHSLGVPQPTGLDRSQSLRNYEQKPVTIVDGPYTFQSSGNAAIELDFDLEEHAKQHYLSQQEQQNRYE